MKNPIVMGRKLCKDSREQLEGNMSKKWEAYRGNVQRKSMNFFPAGYPGNVIELCNQEMPLRILDYLEKLQLPRSE